MAKTYKCMNGEVTVDDYGRICVDGKLSSYNEWVKNGVQECYNQCVAVECGEGECAKAIRTKFPDFVTKYEP